MTMVTGSVWSRTSFSTAQFGLGAVIAVLAAAALFPRPAPAAGFPRFRAGCMRADFVSRGSPVRAELCSPRHGAAGMAVVVLHGCGGFSTFDHRIVTGLPAFGISTLDVDYFEPTPPPGRKGFCDSGGRRTGADPFPVWVQTARDAAVALRRIPGVRHVGIVGWSLGGGVAVQASTGRAGARSFEALVGFSTGSFGAESIASALPPTLLLSGGDTDAIPLQQTLPLYRALRAAHVPAELYVYPHGSHNWPGKQGRTGIARAARFLKRYL